MKYKTHRGSALIEVMAAILLVSIAITAIVELSTRSTVAAGLAKRQAQATALATEKMEALRAIKDSNDWTTFCGSGGSDTKLEYSRAATIVCTTVGGKDLAHVVVEVSWAERGTTKKVSRQITYYKI